MYAKIDIQSTGAREFSLLICVPIWRQAKLMHLPSETAGIPSTFNFRRDSVPGWKEIDFIIATIETDSGAFKSFISTPLWLATDDGTLRKAKTIGELREVDVILAEGTEFATDISKHNDNFVGINPEAAFDQTWAMTWKDFQPFKDYHTYAMSWHPNTIAWYAGEKNKASLRVTLNQKVNDDKIFPTKGPFP